MMLYVSFCYYVLAVIIFVVVSISVVSPVSSFSSVITSSRRRNSNNSAHRSRSRRRSRTTRRRSKRRIITVERRDVSIIPSSSSTSSSSLFSSSPSIDENVSTSSSSSSTLLGRLIQKRPEPTALSIAEITEEILNLEQQQKQQQQHSHNSSSNTNGSNNITVVFQFQLFVLARIRSWQLDELLRNDYEAYIATASFLGGRIPRKELPNVQNIPYPVAAVATVATTTTTTEKDGTDDGSISIQSTTSTPQLQYDRDGLELVPDCTIPETPVQENWVEAVLLYVTRNIYANITGTTRRKDLPGIPGLVEEMRTYMLSPEGSNPQQQQQDLVATLLVLMTPILPPFYRIFMGWKIPSIEAQDPTWLVDLVQTKMAKNTVLATLLAPTGFTFEEGMNYGPAPYAPLLTSWVAPYVFSFLVGPVNYNLRNDGSWGGIVVEKCKFLQQSNCKGMCLHSCKAPAQELFESLGLPLRVSPNFDTQECQWNFGEVAPPPEQDPTWPKGCLVGCGTRETVAEMRKMEKDKGTTTTEVANCY